MTSNRVSSPLQNPTMLHIVSFVLHADVRIDGQPVFSRKDLSGHRHKGWLDYDSSSKTLPAAEDLTEGILLVASTSSIIQTSWTDVAIGALSSDQLKPLLLRRLGLQPRSGLEQHRS